MKQKEARRRARELTSESGGRSQYIASTVPLNAWGGRERGWAVYQIIDRKLLWTEGTE